MDKLFIEIQEQAWLSQRFLCWEQANQTLALVNLDLLDPSQTSDWVEAQVHALKPSGYVLKLEEQRNEGRSKIKILHWFLSQDAGQTWQALERALPMQQSQILASLKS